MTPQAARVRGGREHGTPGTRPGHSRLPSLLAAAALALAACTAAPDPSAGPLAGHDDCRSPSAGDDRDSGGSFEDANLLAAGEMFRVYGVDADPLREQVTGEIVDIDGQPVWRLDADFLVTVEGKRRSDAWTVWVGFHGGELAVLCAHGPADITWPPAPTDAALLP